MGSDGTHEAQAREGQEADVSDPYKRERRLGRWFVSRHITREYRCFEARKQVQDTVLIVDVRHDWNADRIEFLGIGEHFEIVPDGMVVPEYRPVIEGDSVRWEVVGP